VRVTSGQVARLAAIALTRGVVVGGNVVDADTGKPIPGVFVSATSQDSDEGLGNARSGEEGSFELRLPTGQSQISVVGGLPAGYAYGHEDTRRLDVDASMQGKRVATLKVKRITPELRASAPTWGRARGRVVDRDGKPVSGVALATLSDEPDGALENPYAATTGTDGRFVAWVKAGMKHRLYVNHPDYTQTTTDPVTLKAGEDLDVPDLVVSRRAVVAEITGRVVDPDGKPLAGASVALSAGDPFAPRTDSDGRFRLRLREKEEKEKLVPIAVSKPSYVSFQWNGVPPGAKDLEFVLSPPKEGFVGNVAPPTTRPAIDPATLLGKPAPAWQVRRWVWLKHPPREANPGARLDPPVPGRTYDRRAAVLFVQTINGRRVPEIVKQFQSTCDKAGVMPVVLFGPHNHESGLASVFENFKDLASAPLAVGIDAHASDAPFNVRALTAHAYGVQKTPVAYVLDQGGTLRHAQVPLDKLGDVLK
jgi:hypothetical protein